MFDPSGLLRVLKRHDVSFVLIGGMAAILYGSDLVTMDIDVTPQRDTENLERLAGALKELEAKIRTEGSGEDLAFSPDADFLQKMEMLNLTTKFGDLDVVMSPAGLGSYSEIVKRSTSLTIEGVTIEVASLGDIVHSKEASNREKDRAALPALKRLLRRTEG